MPNDIAKLRRLMRTANYIKKETHTGNVYPLAKAWWFESFRDAITNGFARFTYKKKDGTVRTALGTRSPALIPVDKLPKNDMTIDPAVWEDHVKSIKYFDLEVGEWRSFSVLNYVRLDKSWRFTTPVTANP